MEILRLPLHVPSPTKEHVRTSLGLIFLKKKKPLWGESIKSINYDPWSDEFILYVRFRNQNQDS